MLDKAIEHGKEHRKQYRGMKKYDRWLVNHGKDDFANKARLFNGLKRLTFTQDNFKIDIEEINSNLLTYTKINYL